MAFKISRYAIGYRPAHIKLPSQIGFNVEKLKRFCGTAFDSCFTQMQKLKYVYYTELQYCSVFCKHTCALKLV